MRRGLEQARADRGARPAKIDFAGAILLTAATTLVVLGLLEGGQSWALASWENPAVFGAATLLLVVFVRVERVAEQPVLPPWVFTSPVLRVTSAISLLVGGLILGLSSYVPTLGQDVLGASAVVSGFALATLTIGWPISAPPRRTCSRAPSALRSASRCSAP